jgi:hypothetical protein
LTTVGFTKNRAAILFAQPLLAQGLEDAKLVERVQGDALHVLGQRILFAEAALPHHARHGLGLGHPLLLHQQFERPEAAATGRHLEHAGFLALRVYHGPDAQALQERAPGDVLGQLLDGDSCLHPAHIGLAEHQLVEGDVARGAESDLLNGGCHVDILRDGRPNRQTAAETTGSKQLLGDSLLRTPLAALRDWH